MPRPDASSGVRPGWQPYDPAWLVALARKQHPDKPAIADALSRCLQATGSGTACVHFASSSQGVDGSEELHDPQLGLIVVDVLRDGRIGGIEIVGLLPD